ncbi:ATP-binding cassette domain-containing protein [Rhodopirellula sp. JC639]|uniref:ATP-binding cassette domain-containing protein n=1 Tax=Stieleria mannarensis TaxID=2755585 RepID=UPI0015FF4C06|nr:ATP-binding cassette domain-containing protein [Rhodopirellula sp. JC639]
MDAAALVDRIPFASRAGDEPQNVVEVHGVGKKYQRTVALREIELKIRRGEVFGLIGPDGSGKSSLIRAMAGVQQYDAGTIDVFGIRIDSQRSAERVKPRIGLMPQGLGNNLYPELSINENIDYFAGLRLVPQDILRERKEQLLAMTRLAEFRDRPMKQLSGGMKQKLGLVCTLIHQPELVLLDEPTTGVDPVSRREFWSILNDQVHESGMTAIISTAYMDEADYMDRLALLMDGKIISQGSEDTLLKRAPGTIVSYASKNVLLETQRIGRHHRQVQSLGDLVRVFVRDTDPETARECLERIASPDHGVFSTSPPDLEDVVAGLLIDDSAGTTPVTGDGRVDHAAVARPLTCHSDGSASIRADQLVRDFGTFRAVDHVCLEVAAGTIFGLLGSNGAGKTTVIKMLTGLLPPTSGSGSVAGAAIGRASQSIRERIGYMSQSFSLYLDLTAMENLEFYAGVYGLFPTQRSKRIAELVEQVGLQGHQRRLTGDLPMGIRQRLALACALVHRPRVIFLDEPTSGVDVIGRRQFWEILVRLARQDGVAILVTTHYMAEAERCDDLALMYAGRVVASGTPAKLRDQLHRRRGTPLAIATSSPMRSLRLAREHGFPRAAILGRTLRLLTTDIQRDQRRLAELFRDAKIAVTDWRHDDIAMEDVFVDSILTQEESLGQAPGQTFPAAERG